MIDQVIVALDQLSKEEIEQKLNHELSVFTHFKIGLELFNNLGKNYILEFQKKYQKQVFLDIKLHDIPITVFQAIKSLESLPINFLTIHLTGGIEMINQAIKARDKFLPETKLLGVSYLTSLSEQDFSQMWPVQDQKGISILFNKIFHMASLTDIDGLVLSPKELDMVKEVERNTNKSFIKVTPGIRFLEDQKNKQDDQKRVTTPEEAFSNGSNYLVMGRSLINASDLNSRIDQLKKITL